MVDFRRQFFEVIVAFACTLLWHVCDFYLLPEETDQRDLGVRHPCMPNPCRNSGLCKLEERTDDFLCACPLTHRGETCDEPIKSCTALACQEIHDCTLTPAGAICICDESISGRLCLDVHVHQKTFDRFVYEVATDANEQATVFLGSLAAIMLIVSLCLAVHCCRVNKKRNMLREEYKRLIITGFPSPCDIPPDWFQISDAICCCRNPRTRTVPLETFARSTPEQKESYEEFDRLMSHSTDKPLVKNRAPRRVKNHPSSHTNNRGAHARRVEFDSSNSYQDCECRPGPSRQSYSREQHNDSYYGHPDTAATSRDWRSDEYIDDHSNESYNVSYNADISMPFDEHIPLLTSQSTKGKRRKGSRKTINKHTNMAIKSGEDIPHSPLHMTHRHHVNCDGHCDTHDVSHKGARKFTSRKSRTRIDIDKSLSLFDGKSNGKAKQHIPVKPFGQHNAERVPLRAMLNEEDLPPSREGGLRNKKHTTNDDFDEHQEMTLANPRVIGMEDRHTFKYCNNCDDPHFVEISLNEESHKKPSNNTYADRKVSRSSKSNRPEPNSESRTPISYSKYRGFLLSACVPKGNNPTKKCKTKRHRDKSRSKGMGYDSLAECVPACNNDVSFDVSKDIGRTSGSPDYSERRKVHNTNFNATSKSGMPFCNIDCLDIGFGEGVLKRPNVAYVINNNDKVPDKENLSETEDDFILCTNERLNRSAQTSCCTVEGQCDAAMGTATDIEALLHVIDTCPADLTDTSTATRNKQDVYSELSTHAIASSEEGVVDGAKSRISVNTDKAPSLSDVANSCKMWLEQAETIVANLSSPNISHRLGTDGSLFERRSDSIMSPCDSSDRQTCAYSDDYEGTIIASDETDWTETTITAQVHSPLD